MKPVHGLGPALLALLAALPVRASDTPRPKDERDQVTRYHAYHLLLPSQDAANQARARIVAAGKARKDGMLGALNDAARELSQDAESAARGGDLGRVLEGRFGERFETAVLALEPGTLSAPFVTEFGWHLALLTEKRAIPVSLVCGPARSLESGDLARIAVELGPSWRGPAADLSGIVTFLRAETGSRGEDFRDVTLHRELPHAVLVPARNPPACYRSARIRLVADCARQRLAVRGVDYFEGRGAQGAIVDALEDRETLGEADFDALEQKGGARQVYDAACDSQPQAW